jgi:hypothetical protein
VGDSGVLGGVVQWATVAYWVAWCSGRQWRPGWRGAKYFRNLNF